MKPATILLCLMASLSASVQAQVELLPPDFSLFGRNSGEYAAAYLQNTLPLSTNRDYNLPNAVPLDNDPVYFLERPLFGTPPPGVQTYFVPDDAYISFPLVFFWADNVDTSPPGFTVDELRDGLYKIVDSITNVHAVVDGAALTNLFAYRAESPVFSVYLSSSDNSYSVLLGHPLEGLDDPVITSGYFMMFKPLPAGLHDFRTGAGIGPPNSFSFERHFQVYSLPLPQFLARQTDRLAAMVSGSSLSNGQQRPLLATLSAASRSFDAGNFRVGASHLQTFENRLRTKVADNETLAIAWSVAVEMILQRAGN